MTLPEAMHRYKIAPKGTKLARLKALRAVCRKQLEAEMESRRRALRRRQARRRAA